MFCRKGATFSIPYRRKALSDNEVKRAGDGLHPNNFPFCLRNDIKSLDRRETKEESNMETYALRIERMMKRLYDSLAEDDRRRYAAIESTKLGHGGVEYISSVLQCDPKTIRRGLAELEETADLDTSRVRKKGVDAKS
jgi:hypothetical protein